MSADAKPKILVGACGSIGVVNLPRYLLAIKEELQAEVWLCMTDAAQSIVPESTLSYYCDRVIPNNFAASDIDHISLARWCDLLVILPATANTLSLVAAGSAATPLLATVLATPAPIVLFPNMNLLMWTSAAVQRNVAAIRDLGISVIEPVTIEAYEIASRERRLVASMPNPEEISSDIKATLLQHG
jgi:phosphopantothenoylcysteine synthetase/decarboxylase